MWRPLSKLFELFGRLRVPSRHSFLRMRVGEPDAADVLGGEEWRVFRRAEPLYTAWAPLRDGPWAPYHCVTLFAALDRIPRCGPTRPSEAAVFEAGPHFRLPGDHELPPHWVSPETFILVDLPGPRAVALGSRLVRFGCQPVCTFDNWPDPRGVLKPERALAQLLRHAPAVHEMRERLNARSPPVWICDAERLGRGLSVRPRDFDNRYYLDDSLLPGTLPLRQAGIHRLVVVKAGSSTALVPDVEAWLADRARDGFEVLGTALDVPDLQAAPITPVRTRVPTVGRRSSAGGFGELVPEPSSSGG